MDIQWYPGHMTKAKRQMQEDMKLIDLIIELTDARIPASSRNPDISELGKGKSRILILNKADLADDDLNKEWAEYYKAEGCTVLLMNSRSSINRREIQRCVEEACREKLERDRRRGIQNRPVRAMVLGIPNVGKSTFINSFAGRAGAKTGNKPGVTKGKQWIRLNRELELLDTPGILWPKFDDPQVGRNIAIIGSVRDEILNVDDIALDLIRLLNQRYPDALSERYHAREEDPAEMLRAVAAARGAVAKGGEPDLNKAAQLLLDDFRSGKLGRITLESPPEV